MLSSTFEVVLSACLFQANGSIKGHLLHDQGKDGSPHPQRHPAVH